MLYSSIKGQRSSEEKHMEVHPVFSATFDLGLSFCKHTMDHETEKPKSGSQVGEMHRIFDGFTLLRSQTRVRGGGVRTPVKFHTFTWNP